MQEKNEKLNYWLVTASITFVHHDIQQKQQLQFFSCSEDRDINSPFFNHLHSRSTEMFYTNITNLNPGINLEEIDVQQILIDDILHLGYMTTEEFHGEQTN